ncbi:MAG: hypothetical protein K0Q96_750 [Rubrobacteraceae bacterium]|jgi:hypothetical protein|nr:hypothetical protein [Rubrobacteraceae bacterium]
MSDPAPVPERASRAQVAFHNTITPACSSQGPSCGTTVARSNPPCNSSLLVSARVEKLDERGPSLRHPLSMRRCARVGDAELVQQDLRHATNADDLEQVARSELTAHGHHSGKHALEGAPIRTPRVGTPWRISTPTQTIIVLLIRSVSPSAEVS